jgi:hypothetical protein
VPSPPWMYTSMSTRQPTVISTVQAIEPTARKPPNVTAAVASPASPSSLRRCESESVPQGVCSSRVFSCSSGSMMDDIPASDSSGGGGATTTAAAAAGCSRLGGDGVTAVTAPPSRLVCDREQPTPVTGGPVPTSENQQRAQRQAQKDTSAPHTRSPYACIPGFQGTRRGDAAPLV